MGSSTPPHRPLSCPRAQGVPQEGQAPQAVDKAIDKCIAKIQSSQQKDGTWKGGGWAPVLQSSLAGQALEIAQAAGKDVDQDALERAAKTKKQLRSKLRQGEGGCAAGVELYAFAGAQRATASETWEANELWTRQKGRQASTSREADCRELARSSKRGKGQATCSIRCSKRATGKTRAKRQRPAYGVWEQRGRGILSYLMTSESLVITGEKPGKAGMKKCTAGCAKFKAATEVGPGHHCITSPFSAPRPSSSASTRTRMPKCCAEASLPPREPRTRRKSRLHRPIDLLERSPDAT